MTIATRTNYGPARMDPGLRRVDVGMNAPASSDLTKVKAYYTGIDMPTNGPTQTSTSLRSRLLLLLLP